MSGRPSRLVGPRVACAALALAVGSCGRAAPAAVGSSSSIWLDEGRGVLWVASPDDDAVVELSAEDGAELRRARITGGPEALAPIGGRLLITTSRSAELAWLDVETLAVTRVASPCGGTAGVLGLGGRAYVACPADDLVLELDEDGSTWRRRWQIPGGPTALARRDDELLVTASRAGRVVAIDTVGGELRSRAIEAPPGVHASQLSAITIAESGAAHAVYQRVEADADRARDPARGGYGSVLDGAPRIEPRVDGPCGDRYARYDGGARAMSGPSAVAARGGWLWIAHLYTDDVLLARCDETGEAREGELDVVATFRVGRAPRGLALTADGRAAFVDLGFDWAVARLDAPGAATTGVRTPTWTRRRTLGTAFLSEQALRGRSLFFDAVDTHLTPSGVVTCGTCHPAGGEDGLTWFLHTTGVPRKLRRTPPAWAARSALAPYHWDGAFSDAAALARSTTDELMEGDGLLVDFDAIAAFMAELPPPPPRPVDEETAARARHGAEVFARAGCDGCHLEPLRTDGMLHDVLSPATDADARLGAVDTPPLAGVRARAPYFHDGRAPTLRDTVAVADDRHGRTSSLTAADLDDLVLYLETL